MLQVGGWVFATLFRQDVLERPFESQHSRVRSGAPTKVERYASLATDMNGARVLEGDYRQRTARSDAIGSTMPLMRIKSNGTE